MGVDEVVQGLHVELAHNTIDEIADLPIATHLPWEPALETAPLTINVVRAFELRAIPLDAGLRLYVDGSEHELRLMPVDLVQFPPFTTKH